MVAFLITNLFSSISYAGCTGTSPGWVCTPDYSSVNGLINGGIPGGFTEGDTVTLSGGDAVWPATLKIGKFMQIFGGQGTITGPEGNFLITFNPIMPSTNGIFRVSAFNFSGYSFLQLSANGYTEMDKIIIDNNKVTTSPLGGTYFIEINGPFYGVVHSNTVTGNASIKGLGAGCDAWLYHTYDFGASKTMFFEDNIITKNGSSDLGIDGGFGGRYVFRYNTFVRNATGNYYGFDMHGNQGIYHTCGTMAAEFYGNKIVHGSNGPIQLLDQRAGKTLAFYNELGTSSSVWTKIREEYCDELNPVGVAACKNTAGQPQHVSNSYYWKNLNNNGAEASDNVPAHTETWACGCGNYTISKDSEYWLFKRDFNGSSGVGCGTVASLSAACTKGVAYWVTDQSCSSLAGLVGPNPETPIAGTLYQCTATDIWAATYTPFTYPHPLRHKSYEYPHAPINLKIIK